MQLKTVDSVSDYFLLLTMLYIQLLRCKFNRQISDSNTDRLESKVSQESQVTGHLHQ